MKKNAKGGNFSLLAVVACLAVISIAAEARSAPVFPYAVGYSASYSVTYSDGTIGTGTFQITGTDNIGGTDWLHVVLFDIGKKGKTSVADLLCASDSLTRYLPTGDYLLFQEKPVGTSWSYINDSGYPETATIESIGNLTVPLGTFTNVYDIYQSDPSENKYYDWYWEPGVGLLEQVKYKDSTKSIAELTSYELAKAVPEPSTMLLLGSGLLGLAGYGRKKFFKK
jgi:hypothetical protein